MHATKTLMDEHQTILRTLASLEALVTDPAHADESVETFRWIVEFLRTYADRLHHGKEEELLFPALENRGMPSHQGPTAVMRDEHEVGRALVRRMGAVASADGDTFDRRAFAASAHEFVAMLRAHIGKEDHILFPMADRMLGAQDLEQLATAYEEAESRALDADARAAYEDRARQLARRLGVDQERFEAAPACHS